MRPWKGWLRSTIKNSALDTESAKTNVETMMIGRGSANRLKLAKITTSQNSSTMKNGSGIASPVASSPCHGTGGWGMGLLHIWA
jgi:hypothetical protein